MPTFQAGQHKTAAAPVTVIPAGLNCQLELFLGPNEDTKIVQTTTSFTSIGTQQTVMLGLAMPSDAGTYHVYLDLYVEGNLIGAYQATDDVTISAGECTPGDSKCVGYDLYECSSQSMWYLYQADSPTCGYIPPECTPGVQMCEGYDLYQCSAQGFWQLIESNSTSCGYVPPECTPGQTKCEGYTLYECNSSGFWALKERNSPSCGYVLVIPDMGISLMWDAGLPFAHDSIHTAKMRITNKGGQQVSVKVILYAGYNGGTPAESQGYVSLTLNPYQTIDMNWATYQFWIMYSPYTYLGEVWTSGWETRICSERFNNVTVI